MRIEDPKQIFWAKECSVVQLAKYYPVGSVGTHSNYKKITYIYMGLSTLFVLNQSHQTESNKKWELEYTDISWVKLL